MLFMLQRRSIRFGVRRLVTTMVSGRSPPFLTNKPPPKPKRPLSPFAIYQIQLTSVMSIFHRITGAGIALGLYGFGITYGVLQPSAWTETAVQSIHNLPSWLVISGKFALAAPFVYHTFNGIRHLV